MPGGWPPPPCRDGVGWDGGVGRGTGTHQQHPPCKGGGLGPPPGAGPSTQTGGQGGGAGLCPRVALGAVTHVPPLGAPRRLGGAWGGPLGTPWVTAPRDAPCRVPGPSRGHRPRLGGTSPVLPTARRDSGVPWAPQDLVASGTPREGPPCPPCPLSPAAESSGRVPSLPEQSSPCHYCPARPLAGHPAAGGWHRGQGGRLGHQSIPPQHCGGAAPWGGGTSTPGGQGVTWGCGRRGAGDAGGGGDTVGTGHGGRDELRGGQTTLRLAAPNTINHADGGLIKLRRGGTRTAPQGPRSSLAGDAATRPVCRHVPACWPQWPPAKPCPGPQSQRLEGAAGGPRPSAHPHQRRGAVLCAHCRSPPGHRATGHN